jgi:hypothetical protein
MVENFQKIYQLKILFTIKVLNGKLENIQIHTILCDKQTNQHSPLLVRHQLHGRINTQAKSTHNDDTFWKIMIPKCKSGENYAKKTPRIPYHLHRPARQWESLCAKKKMHFIHAKICQTECIPIWTFYRKTEIKQVYDDADV